MRQEANAASSREVQKGNATAKVRGCLQNCWKSQVGKSGREGRIQGKERPEQSSTGFQPKVTVWTLPFFYCMSATRATGTCDQG